MKVIYTCVFAFAFFLCSKLNAQDLYLKAVGPNGSQINGEVTAIGYRDYIQGYSYAQSSSATCTTGTSGGMGGCQNSTGNFFFVLNLDKSTNPMRSILYKGQALQTLEVSFVKIVGGTPAVYQTVKMEEVMILSISDAMSAGGGNSTVQIEFSPTRFGWTYTPQTGGPSGTPVKFGWDRAMNQVWTGF